MFIFSSNSWLMYAAAISEKKPGMLHVFNRFFSCKVTCSILCRLVTVLPYWVLLTCWSGRAVVCCECRVVCARHWPSPYHQGLNVVLRSTIFFLLNCFQDLHTIVARVTRIIVDGSDGIWLFILSVESYFYLFLINSFLGNVSVENCH